MGLCISCEAAAVAAGPVTAKLILPDGHLREFARPIRASHVLGKDRSCFVCDADRLDVDCIVTAIAADEELRLGQIYFLLPRSMLKRPLRAEEMAALAVKASSALAKAATGGKRGRRGAVAPLAFVDPAEATEERKMGDRKGSGKGRKFMPDLGAIPE